MVVPRVRHVGPTLRIPSIEVDLGMAAIRIAHFAG